MKNDASPNMENTSSVPFSGQLAAKEYRRILPPITRKQLIFVWAFAIVFVVAIGLSGGDQTILNSKAAFHNWFPLFLLIVIGPVLIYFMHRLISKGKQPIQLPISGRIGPEGLDWNVGDQIHAKLPWPLFITTKISESVILLYTSPKQVYFIPRTFFASETDWQHAKKIVKANAIKPA